MEDILDAPKETDEREYGKNRFQVNKLIQERINTDIENNIPKIDIYNNVVKRYGTKYEKITGLLVGGALYRSEKQKYRLWQIGMVILLTAAIIATLYYTYLTQTAYLNSGYNLTFTFGFQTLIGIVLIVGILRFKGTIYNAIIIIGILRIFNFSLEWSRTNDAMALIILLLYASAVVLAFVSKKQIFPNLKRKGPKKTIEGEPIF